MKNPFCRATVLLTLTLCACTTVRQLRDPSTLTPDGKATRTRSGAALDYSVATRIAAPPAAVWAALTDSSKYKSWNSTIIKLDGAIALGSQLSLISKDAPDRTFNLHVTTFEAPSKMVWEDGNSMFLGVRHFTLTPDGAGGTVFAMSETFSGGMLGMIEGSLPNFTSSFEAFAADLKKHVEQQVASAQPVAP